MSLYLRRVKRVVVAAGIREWYLVIFSLVARSGGRPWFEFLELFVACHSCPYYIAVVSNHLQTTSSVGRNSLPKSYIISYMFQFPSESTYWTPFWQWDQYHGLFKNDNFIQIKDETWHVLNLLWFCSRSGLKQYCVWLFPIFWGDNIRLDQTNTGHSFFALRPSVSDRDCGPAKITFEKKRKTFSVTKSSGAGNNNYHGASPSTKIPISPSILGISLHLKIHVLPNFCEELIVKKFNKLKSNDCEVDYKNKSFIIKNHDFLFVVCLFFLLNFLRLYWIIIAFPFIQFFLQPLFCASFCSLFSIILAVSTLYASLCSCDGFGESCHFLSTCCQ